MSCILCKSNINDRLKMGKFMRKNKISVHYYCLLLTSNLIQTGEDDEGFLGFMPREIQKEAKRIADQFCTYCYKKSANVSCCAPKCNRNFHLNCGLKNHAVSHFTGTFRTFCHRHSGASKVTRRANPDDVCSICYDKIGKCHPVMSILSPCCKSGWFHKWCLAKFALTAGYFFKCPLCNNTDVFRSRIVYKGIFIPDQDAEWELEPNAFSDLLERPDTCIAEKCLCPNGRNYNEDDCQLMMCETCGSKCIHKICKNQSALKYLCDECSDLLQNDLPKTSEIVSTNTDENEDVDIIGEYTNEIHQKCVKGNLIDDSSDADSLILTFKSRRCRINSENSNESIENMSRNPVLRQIVTRSRSQSRNESIISNKKNVKRPLSQTGTEPRQIMTRSRSQSQSESIISTNQIITRSRSRSGSVSSSVSFKKSDLHSRIIAKLRSRSRSRSNVNNKSLNIPNSSTKMTRTRSRSRSTATITPSTSKVQGTITRNRSGSQQSGDDDINKLLRNHCSRGNNRQNLLDSFSEDDSSSSEILSLTRQKLLRKKFIESHKLLSDSEETTTSSSASDINNINPKINQLKVNTQNDRVLRSSRIESGNSIKAYSPTQRKSIILQRNSFISTDSDASLEQMNGGTNQNPLRRSSRLRTKSIDNFNDFKIGNNFKSILNDSGFEISTSSVDQNDYFCNARKEMTNSRKRSAIECGIDAYLSHHTKMRKSNKDKNILFRCTRKSTVF